MWSLLINRCLEPGESSLKALLKPAAEEIVGPEIVARNNCNAQEVLLRREAGDGGR